MKFYISSDFLPAGDQPEAIRQLVDGLKSYKQDQVLLGVTGSGKTFTMAQVIAQTNRPAMIIAHNKTLAAQLYSEMKGFLPNNSVQYFVSYYDYYQPEAYIAKTDSFIEKDSAINEQIDLLRHAATRSLLERRDSVVVASVSCIYGLGSPELYAEMILAIKIGEVKTRDEIAKSLVAMQYNRNEIKFARGNFRMKGESIDIFPSHFDSAAWRISLNGNIVEKIHEFDPLTGHKIASMNQAIIFPNSHYVIPQATLNQAMTTIRAEMKMRIAELINLGKVLEAKRLEQRTQYDLEMIAATGSCKGIENYSRHLSGRAKGEPPPTLFEYLPKDALLFIDESHVTVSQIGAMYLGDKSRKNTLVEHGFRLPSALDNRPLSFDEWQGMRPQTIFVSATPAKFELEIVGGEVVSQIIRPTGLVDPICEVRPAENQVDDLINEIKHVIGQGFRVMATTLTKKMAEELAKYLSEIGIKVTYLHSDIKTLERIEIIQNLRMGVIDVLIGVNLLREGLDIPECALMAILDADKEGFLRSETSLIQTIGRAARNSSSKVILYADRMTGSMERALAETDRRRHIQTEHNLKHGITPTTIASKVNNNMIRAFIGENSDENEIELPKSEKELLKLIASLEKKMLAAATALNFEEAAKIRDEVNRLKRGALLGS